MRGPAFGFVRPLLLFAMLWATSPRGFAKEYYLDSASKFEGDGSKQHPWRCLDPLTNAVFEPGDKILFARGSRFIGRLAVRQSGTEASPIVVSSYGAGTLPKEDIHIHHNLSLRNQGFLEFVGRVTQDNFQIDHNVSMDYQAFIGFSGPCTNIRLEQNTVVRTLAHREDDSEDVVFWNYFGGNTNINLLNNIFVYDCRRVEPVFSRGEFRHSHNLFYRLDEASIRKQANSYAYERKYLGGGAQLRNGDKIGNPLFRDLAHADFRLKPGSPAIGAGTNLSYTMDFDGCAIPSQSAPDIGAFQYPARNSRLNRNNVAQ